jgi:hypothetical protein
MSIAGINGDDCNYKDGTSVDSIDAVGSYFDADAAAATANVKED